MDEELDYDAKEMIDAFDMTEFLSMSDDMERENGGFLIITDNQCILSYNAEYGKGYHYESTANALCEITGTDKDMGIVPILYNECLEKFIIMRMINEPGIELFIFEIGDLKSITPNQLALFKKFKELYNDQIKEFSKILEKKTVLFEINGKEYEYEDLTPLEEYLETIVDENKTLTPDTKIIGEPLERRNKYV